jgi:hypothetical protein
LIFQADKVEQFFTAANALIPVENHPASLMHAVRILRLPSIDANNVSPSPCVSLLSAESWPRLSYNLHYSTKAHPPRQNPLPQRSALLARCPRPRATFRIPSCTGSLLTLRTTPYARRAYIENSSQSACGVTTLRLSARCTIFSTT